MISKNLFLPLLFSALMILSGCQPKGGEPKPLNIEMIAVQSLGGDVPSNTMWIITPDGTVKRYNFNNHPQYSPSDPLPPDADEYMKAYTLNADDWNRMVAALEQESFMDFPEKIEYLGVTDVGSTYIQITADGETHKSGGWAAGWGKDSENKRFRRVSQIIVGCLNDIRAY